MLSQIGFGTRNEFRGPLIATQTTTDPAANNEFTITVPIGEAWLVESVSVQLVQGLTQTPWPYLTVTDSAGTLLLKQQCGTVAMNASVTAQCTWAQNGTVLGGATDTQRFGNLPSPLFCGPGFVIASSTTGKGANTDYGAASLLVVRYS